MCHALGGRRLTFLDTGFPNMEKPIRANVGDVDDGVGILVLVVEGDEILEVRKGVLGVAAASAIEEVDSVRHCWLGVLG